MGTEMTSAIDQNTEAQRTRSFRPRISSVISVPLCFKSSRAKHGYVSRPVATSEPKRWPYNVALVISDGFTARVGSLTANKERFMTIGRCLEYQLEKVVRGFFDPELFLDYMRYFVLFEDDGDSLIKKIAVTMKNALIRKTDFADDGNSVTKSDSTWPVTPNLTLCRQAWGSLNPIKKHCEESMILTVP